MADPYQLVLGAIAVAIMVFVPIFCVLGYDLLAGRWDEALNRARERRAARANRRRGIRALRQQSGVPIEQLAASLRRLRRIVAEDAHRSAAHQLGNRLAYDGLLIQVCGMLEIEHDLSLETAGFERDIERIRVEAELERAGVMVTNPRYGQAA